MEEIDIIELLKRVKEGKAPKRIMINKPYQHIYDYNSTYAIETMYVRKEEGVVDKVYWFEDCLIELDTKIRILDKPVIEELDYSLEELEETSYNESWLMNCIRANKKKINEIIRYLRSEDER